MALWQIGGLALLWCITGYQIGRLSLEVYDNWENQPDPKAWNTFYGYRLLLFPLNTESKLEGKYSAWFWVEKARRKHHEDRYLLANTLLGPLRVAFFFLCLTTFMVVIPLISLSVLIVMRALKGLWHALIGLFVVVPEETAGSSPKKEKYPVRLH